MEDRFRYRLEFNHETKMFRLVLINTVNACRAVGEIEKKGWKTINESGERDFLKEFVRYVKLKYGKDNLRYKLLRKQMRNYKKYHQKQIELNVNLHVATQI